MKIDSELLIKGYIAAMLWSNEMDDKDESDIDSESLIKIGQICEEFVKLVKFKIPNLFEEPDFTMDQMGHDLWLTSAGSGAGFWDRDFYKTEENRNLLTELSENYKRDIYIGDDNKVHISG